VKKCLVYRPPDQPPHDVWASLVSTTDGWSQMN